MTKDKETQIYLKGKNKTDDILEIEESDCGNKYHITFKNGAKYSYGLNNVEIVEPNTKIHL